MELLHAGPQTLLFQVAQEPDEARVGHVDQADDDLPFAAALVCIAVALRKEADRGTWFVPRFVILI